MSVDDLQRGDHGKGLPLGPLVDGTRNATIHFTKAAFEVVSGVAALVGGVVAVVRPAPDDDDAHAPQHVPVE
jgi:hypothetical protein